MFPSWGVGGRGGGATIHVMHVHVSVVLVTVNMYMI